MPTISKLKVKSEKLKVRFSGYTLVEFLIVIGILSVSVGSVLLILTSVIKGANQANIIAEIKQNGQSVLDSIEKQIRSSNSVVEMSSALLASYGNSPSVNSGITLSLSSGESLHIICVNSVVGTSSGWIGIAKNSSPPSTLASYQALTNSNAVSGVDVTCGDPGTGVTKAMQVNPAGASTQIVLINFIANQGINAPSRADFMANGKFRTTISLRQYQ